MVVGTIVTSSEISNEIAGAYLWGGLHIAFSCLVSLVVITRGIIIIITWVLLILSIAEVNSVDHV